MSEKLVSPEANLPKKIGRPKGATNYRVQLARDLVQRLKCDPLESLLRVIKNKRVPLVIRVDAMKAAVPFVYPKLSAIAVDFKREGEAAKVEAALLKLMESPESLRLAQTLSLQMSKNLRDQDESTRALPAPPNREDVKDAVIIDAEYSDVEPEPTRNT